MSEYKYNPQFVEEGERRLAACLAEIDAARAKELRKECLEMAAPKLLAACQALIQGDDLQVAIDLARAAIAQATQQETRA